MGQMVSEKQDIDKILKLLAQNTYFTNGRL